MCATDAWSVAGISVAREECTHFVDTDSSFLCVSAHSADNGESIRRAAVVVCADGDACERECAHKRSTVIA